MVSLADRNKKRDIENYSKGIDLFVSLAERLGKMQRNGKINTIKETRAEKNEDKERKRRPESRRNRE